MLKKIQAWKSTILGLLLIVGLSLGVYSGKLTQEFLMGMIPCLYLVFSDTFKEHKNEQE